MTNDSITTSTPTWVDRPGPIGGLAEERYYQEREIEPPDPIWRVRRLLRELAADVEPPDRIMAHEPDALGGYEPNDHEVGRLEVLSALTRLEPRDQQIIELAFLKGIPKSRIAQALGISRISLGKRLALALDSIVHTIWDY